ncbi:SH3 domain-containing protein [Streptococcus sp. 11273D007BW]
MENLKKYHFNLLLRKCTVGMLLVAGGLLTGNRQIVSAEQQESPTVSVVETLSEVSNPIDNLTTSGDAIEYSSTQLQSQDNSIINPEVGIVSEKDSVLDNSNEVEASGYDESKKVVESELILSDGVTNQSLSNNETKQNEPIIYLEPNTSAHVEYISVDEASENTVNESTNKIFYSDRSATSSLIGDNYRWKNGNINTDVDSWGYPVRQCTSFVAFRLAETNGFSNVSYLGNAGSWGYSAVNRGATVDSIPNIGAVAWFRPGEGWSDSTYGHVSWVAAVEGTDVILEEYNRSPNKYAYGTFRMPIKLVSGFIHFKDLVAHDTSSSTSNAVNGGGTLASSGTYHFTTRLYIKSEPKISSPNLAYYDAGQSVNYDKILSSDGYKWISYLSFQGNRRYIAVQKEQTTPTPSTTTGNIIIQNKNAVSGSFDVVITNVYSPKGLKEVKIPVWSSENGQDDLVWYSGIKQSDGTYKVSVTSNNHKNSVGLYNIHLYYVKNDGTLEGVATATTVVNRNTSQVTLPQSGTYHFTKRSYIKSSPTMSSPDLAYYDAGQSVNYDKVLISEGYQWISYISYAGNRRYIAVS